MSSCPVSAAVRTQATMLAHAGRSGGQGLVGPGNYGTHGRGRVIVGGEHVQPVTGRRQLGSQRGQRLVRAGDGSSGGDPQRQRQERALCGNGTYRRRLGAGPFRPKNRAQ